MVEAVDIRAQLPARGLWPGWLRGNDIYGAPVRKKSMVRIYYYSHFKAGASMPPSPPLCS